jgi:hypothetical protein
MFSQNREGCGQTPNIRLRNSQGNTQGPRMHDPVTSPTGKSVRAVRVGIRSGKGKRYSLKERLDARTDKSGGPDACWPISGCKVGLAGHGQIVADQGRRLYAHRAAWMLANGPIPDGLVVCHRCDNPRCVNPTHLFLDTQAGNVRDSHRKGRFTAWHRTGRRLNGVVAKRYAHRFHDPALVREVGAELIEAGDGGGEFMQGRHGQQCAAGAKPVSACER